jgi:inhibitor of KinA
VGITGKQTGIYPFNTPGGWQIIGRTPVKLFNREEEPPVLLQPGDRIKFHSITADEFEDHQSRNA